MSFPGVLGIPGEFPGVKMNSRFEEYPRVSSGGHPVQVTKYIRGFSKFISFNFITGFD